MKPRLTILVGMIASGKSTYCAEAANNGCIIINDDAIVSAVHGGNNTLYRKDLKPLYKSIENHIIGLAFAMGLNVVIDRPCFRATTRARYISLAQSLDIPVDAVVFQREAPEVHAMRRAKSDSRGYRYEWWLKAAQAHNDAWVEPSKSEGFDTISMSFVVSGMT